MKPIPLPWNLEEIARPACEQLVLAAQTPNAAIDLLACDVLLWQSVSDDRPRSVQLAVVWLHFLLPDRGRCWALVELCRMHGERSWHGEDLIVEEVREYVSAIASRMGDSEKSIHNDLSRRCQCYLEPLENTDVLNFLNQCSFFNPWVDGVREAWDTVDDRSLNWSGWMQRLGWEPSAERRSSSRATTTRLSGAPHLTTSPKLGRCDRRATIRSYQRAATSITHRE